MACFISLHREAVSFNAPFSAVPPGGAPFTGELLRYAVTGQEPAGSYTWYSGLATPGTLELIGPLGENPFTLSR